MREEDFGGPVGHVARNQDDGRERDNPSVDVNHFLFFKANS